MQTFLDFLQIVFVDIALAGDNAIVVAAAAQMLPPAQRSRAIIIGIAVATLCRIVFTFFATMLLQFTWLQVMGSLALFWISAKMLGDLLDESGKKDSV
jgi:predicted tellurium resistance membrane protein TerC